MFLICSVDNNLKLMLMLQVFEQEEEKFCSVSVVL